MKRFIIEGTWSGYNSGQRRIVHCTVHTASYKKLRAWAEKTSAIYYTDGTSLDIAVMDAKPRERVKEICGYVELIADCAYYDVNSVAALQAKQKEEQKKQKIVAKTDIEEMTQEKSA